MTNIDIEFNEAIEYINSNNEKKINIDDTAKLNFYKFYKQATIGDINIECPNFFYLEKKTKWDAWNSIKGMNTQDAKKSYIKLFKYYKSKNQL